MTYAAIGFFQGDHEWSISVRAEGFESEEEAERYANSFRITLIGDKLFRGHPDGRSEEDLVEVKDAQVSLSRMKPESLSKICRAHRNSAEKGLTEVQAAMEATGKGDLSLSDDDFERVNLPIACWQKEIGLTCGFGSLAYAVEKKDDFPILVLMQGSGGGVKGVLMRSSFSGHFDAQLAHDYAEPHEVERLIDRLWALGKDEQFMGMHKDCNITAGSIEEAIELTTETHEGQKSVLVFNQVEWLTGLWNNPSQPHATPMKLSSVGDFHGVRVSAAKRRSRKGLAAAIALQTIQGDYDVLDKALSLLSPADGDFPGPGSNNESNPAVKTICDWWNARAPEQMRSAATFRVYGWDPNNLIFIAGDPEEPPVKSDALAKIPCFSIFEREGSPAVAIIFYRGRAYNTECKLGTQTYHANGEEAWMIGLDVDQVDEAYFAIKGLSSLRDLLCECWTKESNQRLMQIF